MVQKRRTTLVRRKQIIDAARKLIIRYGSEHATVRRIAHEVGISEAAIYRHFKSKRDILSFLADYIEESLLTDLNAASVGNGGVLGALDNLLRSHISAVEQRRGISFQVIAEVISLGDKKLNRRVTDIISKYVSRLKDVLAEGIKAGEVKENIDPDAAAMLLFGMIQGLVNVWALGSYSFDPVEKYVPLWKLFREAVARPTT